MTQTAEQRRTVEARLDRLKDRLARMEPFTRDGKALVGILRGTLDLLTDVLLEDDPR